MTIGLVLTGGGSRGAYQAGALKAIAEIVAKRGGPMPIRIICGASAGAVNAAFLAAHAADLRQGAARLAEFWTGLRTPEIFRTDAFSLGLTGAKWMTDLVLGRLKKHKGAESLLDTSPLRRLIGDRVPFANIGANIRAGLLDAVEITAMDYLNSESVSFLMARDESVGWARARRRAQPTVLGLDHVMASAAIPLLFPAVSIGGRFYGDGCLRNPAPLSPAIRMGARRLLILGVRHQKNLCELYPNRSVRPTIGRILSVLLNSVLMDSTEFDIERLARLNQMVRSVPEPMQRRLPLHEIDFLHLTPSLDLGTAAADRYQQLPDLLRHLISGLGNPDEASELVSYLFFEPGYCGYLVELGYEDTVRQTDAIEAMLYSQALALPAL